MKPSWNDAPEWANWLAMDSDYDWYWYENKPVIKRDFWGEIVGKFTIAKDNNENWKETLERRPE